MSLDGKLEFIGVTDVGRKRAHNEDSIGSDTGLGIAVLADGMGGYRAGEVASAMAVNMIPHVMNATPGLRNMAELPVPAALMGDVRRLVKNWPRRS